MTNLSSQPIGLDSSEALGARFVESNDQPVSAGMILRQTRETAGLDIAALAVALKVPVKRLEALEMDRHDELLDTVFVRALASSVCRVLKMDAAPVLALLPQSPASSYRPAPISAQASFSAYPPAARSLSRSSVSGPAMVAGLTLAASAAILVFLPAIKDVAASFNARSLNGDSVLRLITGSQVELLDASGRDSVVSLSVPTSLNVANASVVVDSPLRGEALGNRFALPLASANELVLKVPQSLSSVSKPTATALVSPVPSATAGSSTDRLVTFSAATQSSWVKVTDAKGAVVLSRTIVPGEAAFAAGELPLSVVVGRADATRVQIRGQSFDLANYSRDNVARFEVK